MCEGKTSEKNTRTDYNRYQKSEKKLGEFECKLHGYHKRKECKNICGFCGLKGSHHGRDCWRQNQIIREFVEKKIQKYGIMAKSTAESLVKNYGIIQLTEEEFERRFVEQRDGKYTKQLKGLHIKDNN